MINEHGKRNGQNEYVEAGQILQGFLPVPSHGWRQQTSGSSLPVVLYIERFRRPWVPWVLISADAQRC